MGTIAKFNPLVNNIYSRMTKLYLGNPIWKRTDFVLPGIGTLY